MAVIMWLMHADMTCTQWCSWGRGGGERMILRPRAAKIKYYTKKFDLLCSLSLSLSLYIYIYLLLLWNNIPTRAWNGSFFEVSRSHTVPHTLTV